MTSKATYSTSFLPCQTEIASDAVYRRGCFILTGLTAGALNTRSLGGAGLVLTITAHHTPQGRVGAVCPRRTVDTVGAIGILTILQ